MNCTSIQTTSVARRLRGTESLQNERIQKSGQPGGHCRSLDIRWRSSPRWSQEKWWGMVRERHHKQKIIYSGGERSFKENRYIGRVNTRRELKSLQNTFTCLLQALWDEGHSQFSNEDTKAQRKEGHRLAQTHTLSKLPWGWNPVLWFYFTNVPLLTSQRLQCFPKNKTWLDRQL